MGKFIIDIAPMVIEYGEYVNFYLVGQSSFNRGIVTPGPLTKDVVMAAVFPEGSFKLDFDTQGVNLSGSRIVFTKAYFPISNDLENPTDTRMQYDGGVYRLVTRQPYTGNYYIYIAELMRVKPSDLPN